MPYDSRAGPSFPEDQPALAARILGGPPQIASKLEPRAHRNLQPDSASDRRFPASTGDATSSTGVVRIPR